MKTTSNLIVAGIFLTLAANGFSQTTFTKITTGPVVTDGGGSLGCAWGDYDGDGFLDLFVANGPSSGQANFLYHNNRDGTFSRTAEGAIANDIGRWRGCGWADFDNDGHLDLIVGRVDENAAQVILYRNNGDGTFTRMPDNTVGGVVPSGAGNAFAPVWADYDDDGFLDLFVARIGMDWHFHNERNGTFTSFDDVLVELGSVRDNTSATWADYNNDGQPDLFVPDAGGGVNRLYMNLGSGSFTRVSSGSIATDIASSYSAAWADYDNDGYSDLFAANRLTAGRNFLYRNNGDGTFTRMTSAVVGSIVSDPAGFDQCAWGDYDNDGFIDLYLTATPGLQPSQNAGGNALYRNNGDGSFTRITGSPVNEVANSVGCTWGDYDNDGFLDLFVANGGVVNAFENNALYHNNGNSNSWIKVKCVGTVSNRSAIGAKVRAKATIRGRTVWQLREINAGGTGINQNALEAHFGLGNATNIETLRIEWPSGTVQEFQNVAAKQFLKITEPPRLQMLARLPTGSFQFSLNGGRGLQYRVEGSTNLTAWSSLQTLIITNLNGTVPFTDTNAPAFGRRFYRAVLGD